MITRELEFGSAVEYLPLNDPDVWIQGIMRWRQDSGRAERQREPADHGLDIRKTAEQMQQLYERSV